MSELSKEKEKITNSGVEKRQPLKPTKVDELLLKLKSVSKSSGWTVCQQKLCVVSVIM